MKQFVNFLQLIIVAVILYPIYYVWDTDRVEEFCLQAKPGMSQETLIGLADDHHLNLVGPTKLDSLGAQWQVEVPSTASFSNYVCEVKGAGKTVAVARIVKGG